MESIMEKKFVEKAESSVRNTKEAKRFVRVDLLRQKLSNPVRYKWPELTEEVDHQIQLRLQRAFEPYRKILRKVKRRPSWVMDHLDSETPPLNDKEEVEKKRFKQLFCLGVSSVLKGLERDKLRLVLIWKATQPPELKKAVLSLVASTGCPAASISDVLHPVKASFPALSCLTAIGIKKSSDPNVFDNLVQYVKSGVPRIDIPELPKTGTDEDTHISYSTPASISSGNKAKKEIFDVFKYDVHKAEKKGFDEDFIKFSEDSSSHLIEVDEDNISTKLSYGIAAPLNVPSVGEVQVDRSKHEKRGKKRKLETDKLKMKVGSNYKEISIKHFNSNPNKRKKKKMKKMKKKD